LIALDQLGVTTNHRLYGAVSLGNVWQFGVVERAQKQIIQDLNLYRVPADLAELLAVMAGILLGDPGSTSDLPLAETESILVDRT
jgi:hypothetical protein